MAGLMATATGRPIDCASGVTMGQRWAVILSEGDMWWWRREREGGVARGEGGSGEGAEPMREVRS